MNVIILHGWNLNNTYYKTLSKELADMGFRVFVPDLPGFGTNSKLTNVLNLNDYAKFLKRYIITNKINHPILIGHSFGGRVALRFLSSGKTDAKALILTGVPGIPPNSKMKVYTLYFFSKMFNWFIKLLPQDSTFNNKLRYYFYTIVGEKDYYKTSGYLKETFKNIISDSLFEDMKSISIPTLLLWGNNDHTVSISIAKKMQNSIPKSKLVIISDSDHRVPYQKPKEFVNKIFEFVGN